MSFGAVKNFTTVRFAEISRDLPRFAEMRISLNLASISLSSRHDRLRRTTNVATA